MTIRSTEFEIRFNFINHSKLTDSYVILSQCQNENPICQIIKKTVDFMTPKEMVMCYGNVMARFSVGLLVKIVPRRRKCAKKGRKEIVTVFSRQRETCQFLSYFTSANTKHT